MNKKTTIGMGQVKVDKSPFILESIGVGSCLVICIYDKEKKMGGMAHAMLHKTEDDTEQRINPFRFIEPAVNEILKLLKKSGCKKMIAKIVGGASMFSTIHNTVGKDNILATKQKLKKEGIKIVAEDVGGNQGRSVWFDLSDGSVVVSKVYGETISI